MKLDLTITEIQMIVGALILFSKEKGDITDLINKIKEQIKEKRDD